MARDARRRERSGVAPGRGKPRSRATSRTTATKGTEQAAPAAASTRVNRTLLGGARLTRRAIALAVVLALLLFSYAGSLQVYLKQEHDLAMYQQQKDQHDAANAKLQDQLDRWNDDAYVKAQARTRLGWVMPGETGYIVLGSDNQPVAGSNQLGTKAGLQSNVNMTWWQKLWDSVLTADQPTPQGGNQAVPVQDRSTPSASPTNR